MFRSVIVTMLVVFMVAGCAASQRKRQTMPIQKPKSQSYSLPYSVQGYSHTQDQEVKESDYKTDTKDSSYTPAKKEGPSGQTQLTIRQIQRALKNTGYYKGAVDGKMGPQTKEAIGKFQKAKGLKVDGIVGKKTTEALQKHL